jgi:hypothetical protein
MSRCASGRRHRSASLLRQPRSGEGCAASPVALVRAVAGSAPPPHVGSPPHAVEEQSARPPLSASPTGYRRGQGRKRRGGAGWSHIFVAPPPLCKTERASCAAPGMDSLHFYSFGRAPGGATA